MDGIQIIIYIVVALIYFIIKNVNKAAKPPEPNQSGEYTEMPPTANLPNPGAPRKTGPTSFEELLEEVKQSTRKAKTQVIEPKKDRKDRSFREIAEDEDKIRQATQDARKVEQKAYEEKEQRKRKLSEENSEKNLPKYKSKINLVNYDDPENADYEGLDDHQKRFNAFNIPTATPNLFASLLKDPQGARTAFIMSEIFNRKY